MKCEAFFSFWYSLWEPGWPPGGKTHKSVGELSITGSPWRHLLSELSIWSLQQFIYYSLDSFTLTLVPVRFLFVNFCSVSCSFLCSPICFSNFRISSLRCKLTSLMDLTRLVYFLLCWASYLWLGRNGSFWVHLFDWKLEVHKQF